MCAHGNASLNPSVPYSDIHYGSFHPSLAMFSTLFKTFFFEAESTNIQQCLAGVVGKLVREVKVNKIPCCLQRPARRCFGCIQECTFLSTDINGQPFGLILKAFSARQKRDFKISSRKNLKKKKITFASEHAAPSHHRIYMLMSLYPQAQRQQYICLFFLPSFTSSVIFAPSYSLFAHSPPSENTKCDHGNKSANNFPLFYIKA